MAMRLQEVHPSIVHFPIALLPLAIGADLLARATGSERLARIGRTLMPLAAASAAVSAMTGLVAQEEVQAEGDAYDLLATHRSLNVSLVTLTTAMATWRLGRERAGAGYLALGLAGLGAMTYSAYLGGKMVYEHGLGVRPADGLRDGDSPEILPSTAGEVARRVGRDLERGVTSALDDLRKGDVLPALGKRHENPAATPPHARTTGGATQLDTGAAAPGTMP
jgi:uncharacterized membrane protein